MFRGQQICLNEEFWTNGRTEYMLPDPLAVNTKRTTWGHWGWEAVVENSSPDCRICCSRATSFVGLPLFSCESKRWTWTNFDFARYGTFTLHSEHGTPKHKHTHVQMMSNIHTVWSFDLVTRVDWDDGIHWKFWFNEVCCFCCDAVVQSFCY